MFRTYGRLGVITIFVICCIIYFFHKERVTAHTIVESIPKGKGKVRSTKKAPLSSEHQIMLGRPPSWSIQFDAEKNQAQMLTSFSSPYGTVNAIDADIDGFYNPSVLPLPATIVKDHRYLVVGESRVELESTGEILESPEKKRLEAVESLIEDEDIETTVARSKSKMLLTLMGHEYRAYLELPFLKRHMNMHQGDLYLMDFKPNKRCPPTLGNQFKSTKAFFDPEGRPLLLVPQISDHFNCKTYSIYDARYLYPDVGTKLTQAGYALKHFDELKLEQLKVHGSSHENTETVDSQLAYNEPWVPFFDFHGDLHISMAIAPRQVIYKISSHREFIPVRGTELASLHKGYHCLNYIWYAFSQADPVITHATPFVLMTLCPRGTCKPTIGNTVLVGIVHIRPEGVDRFHEHRAVLMNATAPFSYISMSRPLTYLGTNQGDYVEAINLAWDHPSSLDGKGLHHGFSDDVLVISMKVYEQQSVYLDVYASQLLESQIECSFR